MTLIYTNDIEPYYNIDLMPKQSLENVIEYVISELSAAKTRGLKPVDECYFAYGKDVVALVYKPEGISWKIM